MRLRDHVLKVPSSSYSPFGRRENISLILFVFSLNTAFADLVTNQEG